MSQIEEEIADIDTAASAIGLTFEKIDENIDAASLLDEFFEDTKSKKEKPSLTMKQAASEILEEASGGLTTNDLLEIMREKYKLDYARSSLTPQLSRLKYDGIVGRHSGRWILKKFIRPGAVEEEGEL